MYANRTVIEAGKRKVFFNLTEIIKYRDLFWALSYRDFRVRYAQTFLGFIWAFLQPTATLLIFTFIFGKTIKVETGQIPYPVFALAGMIAWSYFSFVMSQASNSIINAQAMIKKIYFPRIIIPLSKAVTGSVDFAITFFLYIVLMLYYNSYPNWNIVWLPVFVIITLVASLGAGIWLSALTIRYRDFQHIVPFLVQIGLYATPIAYPALLVPEKFLFFFYLNPMAGVVEGFRWCLVGGEMPGNYIYISFVVVTILFISSLYYFRRMERIMADIV